MKSFTLAASALLASLTYAHHAPAGTPVALHVHRQPPSVRDTFAFGVNVQNIAIGRPLLPVSIAFIERWHPLLRVPVYWNQVESAPGTYAIPHRYDAIRKIAAAGQSKLVVVLGYNNALYEPTCRSTPRFTRGGQCIVGIRGAVERRHFADYARYLAREMHDEVAVWEVWNEENASAFWQPTPNGAEFDSLLVETASEIHSVAPHSVVISGGTAGVDFDFLHGMIAAGAIGDVNGIGLHMNARLPDSIPARAGGRSMLLPVSEILARLSACYVQGKPYYVTEFGYPLYSPAYDSVDNLRSLRGALRAPQQGALRDTYAALRSDSTIAAAIVFQLQDDVQRLNPLGGLRGLFDIYGNPKRAVQVLLGN